MAVRKVFDQSVELLVNIDAVGSQLLDPTAKLAELSL
jgi:hypothetical protein